MSFAEKCSLNPPNLKPFHQTQQQEVGTPSNERERERENVYASESNYLNMEKIVEEAAGAISDPPSTAPPKSFFFSPHPNRTKPTHPKSFSKPLLQKLFQTWDLLLLLLQTTTNISHHHHHHHHHNWSHTEKILESFFSTLAATMNIL